MNRRRHVSAYVICASIALMARPALAEEPRAPAAPAAAPKLPADENPTAGYIPGYRRAIGLGLAPSAPIGPALPGMLTVPFSAPDEESDWLFNFKGYMSASFRATENTRELTLGGQSAHTLHAAPRIPDAYGMFGGTNVTPGSWVELNFEYGNSIVTSHVKLTTWKPSSATGFTESNSQNFVNEAYLTFKIPPLGPLSLNWTVGAFRNAYGGLGQYGVGQYNAAIIGEPFGVGETLTASYDLNETYSIHVEHGIMGRLTKSPVGAQPTNEYSGSSSALPSSWVNHAHVGLAIKSSIPLVMGLHYLNNFSADDRDQKDDPQTYWLDESHRPDAHMTVVGADIRMIDNHLGNFGLAASHASAKDAELLTGMVYFGAFTGDQATQRYFGPHPRSANGSSINGSGTGSMTVVGGEYNLSWGKLIRYPEEFWGEGPDLITSAFATVAAVQSEDPDFDKVKMYKFGTEITYRFLPWVGLSGRYDHVSPNSRDTNQNFEVLSPKILLKTDWNSHELVTLSYTRWIYGSDTHAQFPNDFTRTGQDRLDAQMFAIHFGMWW
jgi:hypothetical protein